MSLTNLEKIYVLDLAKKLKRTDQFCKNFTSNSLKRYFELYLLKETLGGIDNIPSKDFFDAMENAGLRSQRVFARSPQFYFNICERNVMELFGNVI